MIHPDEEQRQCDEQQARKEQRADEAEQEAEADRQRQLKVNREMDRAMEIIRQRIRSMTPEQLATLTPFAILGNNGGNDD